MFLNRYRNIATMFVGVVLAVLLAGVSPGAAENIESGYQTIQGTRVYTNVYHERGYATFENDCGKQRLTQRELQQGAIPSNIIPCPRPGSQTNTKPSDKSPGKKKRLWSAVAAGIDNGFLGVRSKVSIGLGQDYSTRAEAERAAVKACKKNISSCKVVTAWNSGCYYITVSENADNVAWGAGPTAQAAYNECYRRVQGGNCSTETLGGCYSD